jgi:hypothetical protein
LPLPSPRVYSPFCHSPLPECITYFATLLSQNVQPILSLPSPIQ